MGTQVTGKKLIVRNTIFLYIRKIVCIFLGFYTSRLLLRNLGIDDFGLYGLVGTVIILFSSMRGLFAGSIQRFVNVAKSSNGGFSVGTIFSLGMKIHLWLALLFFLAVEAGGAILIPTLNIPPGSETAAWLVFHLSLLAAVATILTVPYEALIIANEKFNALSAIGIAEQVLKLLIVLSLVFWSGGRIVWYSVLLLAVSVAVLLMNVFYCRVSFGHDAKYRSCRNTALIKEMTTFAGWNFLGSTACTVLNAGSNFVLNVMGGVAVNAARGIAYQVQANVTQFVADLGVSFQPQSVRLYADGDMRQFYSLMNWNSKVSFFICGIMSFSICSCSRPLLGWWLGIVPPWTDSFTQTILLYAMARSLHGPVDTLFKAAGVMKWYQIAECVIMLSTIVIGWMVLKAGAPYYMMFVVMAVMEIANLVVILLIARSQCGFDLGQYVGHVGWRVAAATVAFGGMYVLMKGVTEGAAGFVGLAFYGAVCVVVSFLAGFFILFDTEERKRLLRLLKIERKR